MQVNLKFTRNSTVIENGGVTVEVEDGASLEDALEKAHNGLFKQFLVTERTYYEQDWTFEPIEKPNEAT